MADDSYSRRRLLGTGTAALTAGVAGCTGILQNGTDEESAGTPTTSLPYSEDFEDGSLNDYQIVPIAGDDDTESYHVTSEPSRGEYAVKHRTESRYLAPRTDVALAPPLTFSLDFFVEGWSGIDIVLQHDASRDLTYLVKVRDNNNGPFVELSKNRNELAAADSETLVTDRNENNVFTPRAWETVEIDWESDGTITAAIPSSAESVSITDTDLSGHPFRLRGYHYDGSATIDNIEIRR